MPSLEKRYPELNNEFPEEFIYLFDSKSNLNSQGKMAQEVLRLRTVNAELKKQTEQSYEEELKNALRSLESTEHDVKGQQVLEIYYTYEGGPRPVCTIFVSDKYIQFHDEFTQLGQDIPELKSLIDAGWDNNHT
jgi:hypothetical protein